MMGGILANNSSGMCCGVEQNAYHTLESIRFVLPDGLVVDSAAPDADRVLEREAPGLVRGLLQLKDRLERDDELRNRVRAKYKMKNTMGYSLNAFLDYDTPVEILAHLMIGSERARWASSPRRCCAPSPTIPTSTPACCSSRTCRGPARRSLRCASPERARWS